MSALTAWHTSMIAAGLSERTITERVRIVQASGLDLLTADVWQIEAWLAAHPEWSAGTKRSYTDALRVAFSWARTRGLRADDPMAAIPPVKTPRGVPHPVSTHDLGVLLQQARPYPVRGYLLLAAYAGLRVAEIARVQGQDITDGHLFVTGKGDRSAVLPLHPLLVSYAAAMPRSGWWFPSPRQRDTHVTGNNVSAVIGDHMHRCGVPGTAHSLQHWFGTQLVAGGTQMRVVQESLRHANLQTTQIYTAVSVGQLAQAICSLPDVA